MTWTKFSDDFTDIPEFLGVPRSERLLLVEMYIWANRLERDGRVPFTALRRLSDIEEPETAVKLLEEAGMLDIDDGMAILDWSDQDSAEDVQERRAYRAGVQKKYRKRKGNHDRGDHSLCDPRYCKKHSVTDNASSNETADETPSRPAPSRPKGRGQGQGAEASSAGAPPASRPSKTKVCHHGLVGGMFTGSQGAEMACADCQNVTHRDMGWSDANQELTVTTEQLLKQAIDCDPVSSAEFRYFTEHDDDFEMAVALAQALCEVWRFKDHEGTVVDYELEQRLTRRVFMNVNEELAKKHEWEGEMSDSTDGPCWMCSDPRSAHVPSLDMPPRMNAAS